MDPIPRIRVVDKDIWRSIRRCKRGCIIRSKAYRPLILYDTSWYWVIDGVIRPEDGCTKSVFVSHAVRK